MEPCLEHVVGIDDGGVEREALARDEAHGAREGGILLLPPVLLLLLLLLLLF